MAAYFDSYCGLVCKDCEKKDTCGGCFFGGGENCAIAACAGKRNRRFCGECGDFPCETMKRYAFDPEQGDGGRRIENCKAIKTALVAQARRGVDPVSVCGHHCDHCFLGQWCGGCRSEYNCCSFATLFPDDVCPNVRCASGKGVEGCYACPELSGCAVGFYGLENQHAAKATALFIRKYGKEAYSQTLSRAIAEGLEYTKDLDSAGSPDAALSLLEAYIGGTS